MTNIEKLISERAQMWHDIWCHCGFKFGRTGSLHYPLECPNFNVASADLRAIADAVRPAASAPPPPSIIRDLRAVLGEWKKQCRRLENNGRYSARTQLEEAIKELSEVVSRLKQTK